MASFKGNLLKVILNLILLSAHVHQFCYSIELFFPIFKTKIGQLSRHIF